MTIPLVRMDNNLVHVVCGGIGRRARLWIWYPSRMCGFKSRLSTVEHSVFLGVHGHSERMPVARVGSILTPPDHGFMKAPMVIWQSERLDRKIDARGRGYDGLDRHIKTDNRFGD